MLKKEDIVKLAELARLELSNEELDGFQHDMDSILGYVDQIGEVTAKVSSTAPDVVNTIRADENPHESELYTDKIMKEVPNKKDNLVEVKKIL